MEKIGEILVENEIKIMDAFDVIEQFTLIKVSNLQPGLWVAYNKEEEVKEEWGGNVVTDFIFVNKQYFEKNNDYKNYNWEIEKEAIVIEKGIIGIFNESFKFSENYYNEMMDEPYNESAPLKNYVSCRTPFGEDGGYFYDIVKENEKIVAIKINFPNECNQQ